MTYYTADKNSFKKEIDWPKKAVITGLIIVGLLIGASVGLYIAARTLPLPNTEVHNYYRTP